MKKNGSNRLKFFGIGRILPYLRNVRMLLLVMVLLGLLSSIIDIIIPLYQRYALDHFVGLGIFDTIVPFIVAYLATIIIAAIANYISCAAAKIVEVRVNRDVLFLLQPKQRRLYSCTPYERHLPNRRVGQLDIDRLCLEGNVPGRCHCCNDPDESKTCRTSSLDSSVIGNSVLHFPKETDTRQS